MPSLKVETPQKIYVFGNSSSHKDEFMQILESYYGRLYERNSPQRKPSFKEVSELLNMECPPSLEPLGGTERRKRKDFNLCDFSPTVLSAYPSKEIEIFYPKILSNFGVYVIVFNMKELLYRSTHQTTVNQLIQYFQIIRTYAFEEYHINKEAIDNGNNSVAAAICPRILFVGTEDEEIYQESSWSNWISFPSLFPASTGKGNKINNFSSKKSGGIRQFFHSFEDVYQQIHDLLHHYFHQYLEYNEIVMYFPDNHSESLRKVYREDYSFPEDEDVEERLRKRYNFFPITTSHIKKDLLIQRLLQINEKRDAFHKRSIWKSKMPFFGVDSASKLAATKQGSAKGSSVRSPLTERLLDSSESSESFSRNLHLVICENEENILGLNLEDDRYRLLFDLIASYFIDVTSKMQETFPTETLLGYYQAFMLFKGEKDQNSLVLSYDRWIEELKQFSLQEGGQNLSTEEIVQGTNFLCAQKLLIKSHPQVESLVHIDPTLSPSSFHDVSLLANQHLVLNSFHYAAATVKNLLLNHDTKSFFAASKISFSEEPQRGIGSRWDKILQTPKNREEFFHDSLIKREVLKRVIDERDFPILEYFGILAPITKFHPVSPNIYHNNLTGPDTPHLPSAFTRSSGNIRKSKSRTKSQEIKEDEEKEEEKNDPEENERPFRQFSNQSERTWEENPLARKKVVVLATNSVRNNSNQNTIHTRSQTAETISNPRVTSNGNVITEGHHYYYFIPNLPKFTKQIVGLKKQKILSFESSQTVYVLLVRRNNESLLHSYQKLEWKECKDHSIIPKYFFQRLLHRLLMIQSEFMDTYNKNYSCEENSSIRQRLSLYWNTQQHVLFKDHCVLTLHTFDHVVGEVTSVSTTPNSEKPNNTSGRGSRFTIVRMDSSNDANPDPSSLPRASSSYSEKNVKIKISLNSIDNMVQIDISKYWRNPLLVTQFIRKQIDAVLQEFYPFLISLPVLPLPSHPSSFVPPVSSSNRTSSTQTNNQPTLLMPLDRLNDLVLSGHNKFLIQSFRDHSKEEAPIIDLVSTPSKSYKENFERSWNMIKEQGKSFLKEFYDYHVEQLREDPSNLTADSFISKYLHNNIQKPSIQTMSPFHQLILPENITTINYLKSYYNSYLQLVKYYQYSTSPVSSIFSSWLKRERTSKPKSLLSICFASGNKTFELYSNTIENIGQLLTNESSLTEVFSETNCKNNPFSLLSLPFHSVTQRSSGNEPKPTVRIELLRILYSHCLYFVYDRKELTGLINSIVSSSPISEDDPNEIIYQWILLVLFFKSVWAISHIKHFLILITSAEKIDTRYFYQLFSFEVLQMSRNISLNRFWMILEDVLKEYCDEIISAYSSLCSRETSQAEGFDCGVLTKEFILEECEMLCKESLFDLIMHISVLIDLTQENPLAVTFDEQPPILLGEHEDEEHFIWIKKPTLIIMQKDYFSCRGFVEAILISRTKEMVKSLALEHIIPFKSLSRPKVSLLVAIKIFALTGTPFLTGQE